jgi:type 2 lantibiotic biosynthesis protein LanM
VSIRLLQKEVLDIVAAASTLHERLASGWQIDRTRLDENLATTRLDDWREVVARGDRDLFARRLKRDHWDAASVLSVLGATGPADPSSPSDWTSTLLQALELAWSGSGRPSDWRFCDAGELLPFQEIVAPFILVARAGLAERINTAEDGFLAEEAQARLERLLLRRLTILSARVFYLEFSIERAARHRPLERLLASANDVPSCTLYGWFVEHMRRGGLADLFRRYPMLARLMARVTDLWVEGTAEFLERLRSDREEIQCVFGGKSKLGQVITLDPGLSDPHRGGRMVIALTFASGTKVVYKPKDIGTEQAYNRLLFWFNQQRTPLPFRVLTLIARPGYGWVEWVDNEPCRDPEEVCRYYQRAGMLVCLVYALAGTDCHRGNVIASGEHPVLVDAETLMHHRARSRRGLRARELALDELVGGVLGTGLLPSWQVDKETGKDRAVDISGLHTADEQELVVQAAKWEGINTDEMVLSFGPVGIPRARNQPLMCDRLLRLEDHAGEVLKGFEWFYENLVKHRVALLAPDSPLHELARQQVRFICRNTRAYGALHERLCDPGCLRDGSDWGIQLEVLVRDLYRLSSVDDEGDSPWWAIVAAERDALNQMDIPLFTARADSVALVLAPGRELHGCLREPSAELVMNRLRSFGQQDLRRQIGFIAGSLYANSARHGGSIERRRTGCRAIGRRWPIAPDEVALGIAAQISSQAIISPGDHGATWIAPQYLPRLERYQFQPIGYDLHSGACGVALFLASVERATGGAGYRQLAMAALQPLRDALAHDANALGDAIGVGGATGLGSLVYALTRVAQFIDEPDLLCEAAAAASLVSEERIGSAPADVFAGLAGDILGLLTLYTAVPDPAVLQRAVACGRRLLSTQTHAGDGAAWVTFKGKLLTGFSHGAAGIAYALLRLYAATGHAAYHSAAMDAIAYEDGLFERGLGNWPDLREDVQPAYKANWCHGAPGIGLARLGGLPMLDTVQVRRDIEAAVRTTLLRGHEGPDHLCCGNLGRADVLLTAGERLGRSDLFETGCKRVQDIASRAHLAGGFSSGPSHLGRVFMPGFFMGMSGIGYELLRAAHLELLPSVLLWE